MITFFAPPGIVPRRLGAISGGQAAVIMLGAADLCATAPALSLLQRNSHCVSVQP